MLLVKSNIFGTILNTQNMQEMNLHSNTSYYGFKKNYVVPYNNKVWSLVI
jgi:hypothetical protein